ncbi:hypothetical protein GGD83_002161 [Rhodoblastus sphagnicola]|nr:hypothetical protein [Rhodoblastus sphagnicola]MBB4198361.1 hypothetical protein [Rhodoblastus sphagnicola]
MTAAFGRRNRPATPRRANPAPKPDLVLTPEQRAYLFGGIEREIASDRVSAGASPKNTPEPRPIRRAGLIACAAMTAVMAALSSIGAHNAALAGLPTAIAPMSQDFLALIGSAAGPFALAWSIVVNFTNFSANLWVTRHLAAALELASPLAFAGLGALFGLGLAWLSAVLGLGESDIGLAMEAVAGAGVAALYRLLSGPAKPLAGPAKP